DGTQTRGPRAAKVQFKDDFFLVKVSSDYDTLVEKIRQKMGLLFSDLGEDAMQLRYEDKDGDMVMLTSSEDLQMALEEGR
ncbi:hypothetical protein FB45DRAFT_708373, partial [Roridomyces roridus]